ncbi:hypothetical protein AX17_005381 [Amanita inopinata Kibby_2008]|nr:hypothetical protein AX17_005381 [Amanita inopinata Kibby_2008]
MTIILYDFPSKVIGGPWNPNTWRTRFTLNYKGIPYRTEWIQYTEIERVCKEKGIPPSTTKADGSPSYTLPSIWDTEANVGVSDSHSIAVYLDKAFPDKPRVIPPGTEALQTAFIQSLGSYVNAMRPFTIPATLALIDHEPSYEYFYKTRSAMFGQDLKTMGPSDAAARDDILKKTMEGLNSLDQILQKSSGPYIMDGTISFADFALGSWLKWVQLILGKDSDAWKAIVTWNEGRWAERLGRLEQYAQIQ